jgi:replication factor C small subunit
MFDNLWVEKYRPAKLDDIILSDENRTIVQQYESNGEIPNLLFCGNPGTGKTSLAKVIVNNILECQHLYINASDENGIDTIRSKVTQFAQTRSFDGSIKVIILDECDGLSQDAQRALRNTMEEFAAMTRFILTANYNHKIIPALQSRCQSLDLTPPLDACMDRLDYILLGQGITVDDEQRKQLKQFAKVNYPDLRRIINEVQKYTVTGSLKMADNSTCNDMVKKVLALTLSGHVLKVRKFVIENEEKFNGDYTHLLRQLFDYIDKSNLTDTQKGMGLVIVAESMYRSAFVVDQEINFYSCMIQLSNVKS